MLVIFVFDGDRDRTREVIWQKAEGLVVSKQWFPDGVVRDTVLAADDLVQALEERGGIYSPCHPAEVGDELLQRNKLRLVERVVKAEIDKHEVRL